MQVSQGPQLPKRLSFVVHSFVIHETYMIAGDEYFGFDPNAFVQRLIEETGISHVWEPVATKVLEGGRTFSYSLGGRLAGTGPRC